MGLLYIVKAAAWSKTIVHTRLPIFLKGKALVTVVFTPTDCGHSNITHRENESSARSREIFSLFNLSLKVESFLTKNLSG